MAESPSEHPDLDELSLFEREGAERPELPGEGLDLSHHLSEVKRLAGGRRADLRENLLASLTPRRSAASRERFS